MSGAQLLDSRGIGKGPNFNGKREEFEEWIFPFESSCSLLGWSRWTDGARDAPEVIARETLTNEANDIGRSSYQFLVSQVMGTALSLVKLTARGSGFEALRKLYHEHRPRLNEEHGTMLQQILTP